MTEPNEADRREAKPATRSPGSAPAPADHSEDGEPASATDQAAAAQERMLETGEENPV